MARSEGIFLPGASWNGPERPALFGRLSSRPRGIRFIILAMKGRQCPPAVGAITSPLLRLLRKSSSLTSLSERLNLCMHAVKKNNKGSQRQSFSAKKGKEDNDGGADEDRDENGFDKFGLDKHGLDKYGIPGDAILDGKISDPEYTTYIDPQTGEPSPTYGARTPFPNAAFWVEDHATVQRSAREPFASAKSSFKAVDLDDAHPDSDTSPKKRGGRRKGTTAGRKRKTKTSSSSLSQPHATSEELSEEELANRAQLEILRNKFRAEEEEGGFKPINEGMEENEAEEKVVVGTSKEKEKVEKEIEEEDEDTSLLKVMSDKGYALVRSDVNSEVDPEIKPLTNEELWWNWRKPADDEKPWSAWQKRPGDCDTVMAAAMAEIGQIKLFGEKPTIAEATLARARKRVFYNERMEAEQARKNEIGAMAYYKEWVKAYKGDTSKEAVEKHFKETGEEVGIQLLDMFAYQTQREYRIMQGTDIRIQRDPLTMRMRPEQIKQVWGGDPVYPTINYVQDPDEVYDYRNENMHEPIPDMIELLRESGRLITQEELKELLEQEKMEEDELGEYDILSGAVDIGDQDDEEDNDEDEELSLEQLKGQSTLASPAPKKSTKPVFELEEEEEIDQEEVKDISLPDE